MCACGFGWKSGFDLIELVSQDLQFLRGRFGELGLDVLTRYLQFLGFLFEKFLIFEEKKLTLARYRNEFLEKMKKYDKLSKHMFLKNVLGGPGEILWCTRSLQITPE